MLKVQTRPVAMTEIDDPDEISRARAEGQQFDSNRAWFNAHADEIYAKYLGKRICVSQGEVFASDSSPEAIAMAKAAYPDDNGRFNFRISREKAIRINAH
jgi:hypothetical protein